MKSKKILAGVCASLMLAATALPTVYAADGVKVTVGNAQAKAGAAFEVKVDLADIPAAGINACDFGIKYDSSLITVTGVTAGALAKNDNSGLDGVNALETNIEAGLVSVIYGLGDASASMTGSGTFLTIAGTVNASAAVGSKAEIKIVAVDRTAQPGSTGANTDIIFGNLGSDNTSAVMYTPTITDGWVEVIGDAVTTTPAPVQTTPAPVQTTPAPVQTTPAPVQTTPAPVQTTPAPVQTTPAPDSTQAPVQTTPTPTTQAPVVTAPGGCKPLGQPTNLGDVDLNGEVGTIADLVTLGKYIVSPTLFPLSDESLANSDVNRDGVVDTADLSRIVEYALGKLASF